MFKNRYWYDVTAQRYGQYFPNWLFWVILSFSLNFPLFPNALKGLDDGVGERRGVVVALLRPHPLLTHNLYQQYKQYSRRFPIIFNLQNKMSITVRYLKYDTMSHCTSVYSINHVELTVFQPSFNRQGFQEERAFVYKKWTIQFFCEIEWKEICKY